MPDPYQLPSDGEVAVPQSAELPAKDVVPLNAFLVEDNTDIRDTIVEAMQEMAPVHFVGVATNEVSAKVWLVANEGYWDIAVIDLMLLQGSGFGVIGACAHRSDMQKVVVLTGFIDMGVRQRCLDLGADEVFDKTQDIEKFVNYCRVHATYLAFMRESGMAPLAASSEMLP